MGWLVWVTGFRAEGERGTDEGSAVDADVDMMLGMRKDRDNAIWKDMAAE